MKSLKNSKATGNDEIPIEYLKSVGEDTKAKIVQMIKNIYKGDEIPPEWLETVFIALPKKQGTAKCEEHRTIALIPHVMKILNKVTYNRISTHLNEQHNPMQYGFRPKVGTIESITALKTILANSINSKQDTYICFIDFKKAFDRVEHDILIDILNKKAIPANEIRIIKKIYENQIGFMKDDSEKQYPIHIKRGVRQGCILSPILFNTYAEETFKLMDENLGIPLADGRRICRISYADDTVLLSETEKGINEMLDYIQKEGKKYSIEMNVTKTKSMVVTNKGHKIIDAKIGQERIGQVRKFQYLGATIDDNLQNETEIRINIAKAKQSFWKHKELMRNNLPMRTKKKLLNTQVWSILKYGSEVFSLTTALKKKITAFEMWCYRRILKISWTNMITNEEVLRRVGEREAKLLKMIIKRKMAFFGHIVRASAGQ